MVQRASVASNVAAATGFHFLRAFWKSGFAHHILARTFSGLTKSGVRSRTRLTGFRGIVRGVSFARARKTRNECKKRIFKHVLF